MTARGRDAQRRYLLCVVLALAGCSHPPTAPTAPTVVTPPEAPVVVGLTVSGPGAVAPGSDAQYRATAKFQDGRTQDVTDSAVWTSSKTSVLELRSGGGARGRDRGAAVVSAKFNGVEHSMAVRVLEAGTFVVSGSVLSTDSTPLAANIAVESGTGSGLATSSDAAGAYELYGVAGDVRLLVTASGHQGRAVDVSVTRDTTSIVILAPVVPELPVGSPSALIVTGPERFAASGTVQYRAWLEYTNGRREDVTQLVSWSVSKVIGPIMSIGQDGVVRATGLPGRAIVRATFGRFSHELTVNAGPGWVVYGSITDAATGESISWAMWEVVGGTAYAGD